LRRKKQTAILPAARWLENKLKVDDAAEAVTEFKSQIFQIFAGIDVRLQRSKTKYLGITMPLSVRCVIWLFSVRSRGIFLKKGQRDICDSWLLHRHAASKTSHS
jgi:hypothetical protein